MSNIRLTIKQHNRKYRLDVVQRLGSSTFKYTIKKDGNYTYLTQIRVTLQLPIGIEDACLQHIK